MQFRLTSALWATLALATACATPAPHELPAPVSAAPQRWDVSPDLQITELRPGLYVHTTWSVLGNGVRYPANGLLVEDQGGMILVDTGWGVARTEELVTWARDTMDKPITQAVSTHAHDDRAIGAPVLARHGVRHAALPLTRELAARDGVEIPEALALENPGDAVTIGPIEVFYPGPGHAPDNLMVYVPAHRVLFGGCAVRPGDAADMGYTGDADMVHWDTAIAMTQARYPQVELVVPGHEATGGPELLAHTRALLATHPAPTTDR